MSKLDDLIIEALSAEEQDILKNTEELGWFALGTNLFKGKLGWVSWVIMITQTMLLRSGADAAWRVFQTSDVVMAMRWGFSATLILLAAMMLKMSMMPHLQANRVLRELKRVELLLLNNRP